MFYLYIEMVFKKKKKKSDDLIKMVENHQWFSFPVFFFFVRLSWNSCSLSTNQKYLYLNKFKMYYQLLKKILLLFFFFCIMMYKSWYHFIHFWIAGDHQSVTIIYEQNTSKKKIKKKNKFENLFLIFKKNNCSFAFSSV